MTATRNAVIATAGHVDHGKSAIVRALTGTDPDRLPEEKRRGMTIDLGFAHLTLTTTQGGTLDVGLVDVPGHEDFVKNMVAGVGAIDATLLVIAADDGPMPQTREHVQILTYLGVQSGVVALSKIDLCADVPAAVAKVRAWLAGTPLADAPIVPTSTRTTEGLDHLRRTLAAVLEATPPAPDTGKPRLAVDRVFVSAGAGTVVTGTLTGGRLTRGQSVVIQPAGHMARVRGIQTHHRDADHADGGSRVALNLPGIAADGRSGPAVTRGDVVTLDGVGRSTSVIDVGLIRTPLDAVAVHEVVRDGSILRVHHRSAAVSARVRFGPAGLDFARLTLERPLHVLLADRLVLRDAGGQRTLVGGVVLDVAPPARRRPSFGKNIAQLALLSARQIDPHDARASIRAAIARDGWLDPDAFRPVFPAADPIIDAVFAQAIERDGLLVAGRYLVEPSASNAIAQAILTAVDAHHAAHPQQQGVSIQSLERSVRSAFAGTGPEIVRRTIVDAVIGQLCRHELVRTAAVLHRAAHRPALPPRLQAAGDAILKVLTAHPFDPPSSKEICRTDAMIEAMKFLVATGRCIDLGQHTVLSADAYATAIDRIRAQLKVTGSATVSELKITLGSSRRIMVPLLERLDRDRVTRRTGDTRSLA